MTSRRTGAVRAGLTIVEVVVVVVIVVILAAILLPAMTPKRHGGGRQLKDSSQIRGVMQGMVLWAQGHQDRYPLPSLIDTNNTTVPEIGAAKDTTANVLSVLVYNSFFPPELLYSPAEANGKIVRMEGYSLDAPAGAVDPAKALWDPALRADFTGKEESHVSYAHTMPRGGQGSLAPKLERWGATYIATQAALGNRGPEITAVTRARGGSVAPTYAVGADGKRVDSLTLLIHGSRVKWEGNIGYNDNHVNFETNEAPEALTYTLPDGKVQQDVLFYDEPEVAGLNNFLGVFTKAGVERKDFVTIWD
jgi:type II secretory pathway pseudopilin PulG